LVTILITERKEPKERMYMKIYLDMRIIFFSIILYIIVQSQTCELRRLAPSLYPVHAQAPQGYY